MRVAGSKNERIGSKSMSARPSNLAAKPASSAEISPLRTFFHKMFAHSAVRRSAAAKRWLRNAKASRVPSSSMTHLIATLASIRKLLTVRRALPSAEPRQGYGGVPVSAPETRQPSRQKLVQPRWRELGAEFPYVPL